MSNRGIRVFSEKRPEPPNPVSLDDVIRVKARVNPRRIDNMSSHNDGRAGRVLSNQIAHLFDLADVGDDRADTYDVVLMVSYFFHEAVESGEIQKRTGRIDIGLNHHKPERSVEHAKRKTALKPRDLVVVKLHRIDHSASVFVVLGIGSEDAGQQDSRMWPRCTTLECSLHCLLFLIGALERLTRLAAATICRKQVGGIV